jgi:hypothetical protein
MALIVANTDFCSADGSFQHAQTYDTALPWVAAANTAHPEHFYASGGTKTANTAFVMTDSRAGGFERIIHVGDVLPSGDPAVTAAPSNFS